MSDRKLTILGIVAVLMVVWAVVQTKISKRSARNIETAGTTYLIQGLEPNGIDRIVIGQDKGKVNLQRKENSFVVVEKDNYPAKNAEVNKLLASCLDIKRDNAVYTANPSNYKDLGVTQDAAENVIKFFKPNSELITGIIIGKNKEEGSGTFVRMIDSNNVYVVQDAPFINNMPNNYIELKLIEAKRQDITEISVAAPDGKYTLKSDDKGAVTLENLPAGKKLIDVNEIFDAFGSLTFDDVRERSKLESQLKFDTQVNCKLKDSTLYTLRIAKKDNKYYVVSDAEFTDTNPIMKEQGVESQEALKAKETKLLARDKAQIFSLAHKDWIYIIPDYTAQNFTKKLSNILEDIKPPAEPNTPADANVPQAKVEAPQQ